MDRFAKTSLLALKIGVGSSIAIFIAQLLHLDYAVSAGTVTLLTLMTSKWGTLKLAVGRFVTLAATLLLGLAVFHGTKQVWATYGMVLLAVVFFSELAGWRATISVNAVAAAHLVTGQDFSFAAIWNEAQLVTIGVVIAIILNLFHMNPTHKRQIIADMRDTEKKLQDILRELAAYLSGSDMRETVWDDICHLEEQLLERMQSATEYQENTFSSHPGYYISYFEMRYDQCRILHDLHDDVVKIIRLPKQAMVISDYLYYLTEYVTELNPPEAQVARLEALFDDMKREELPKSREEFENRALLYHILMDIRDFLSCKMDFVSKLDERQRQLYWKNGEKTRTEP